MVQVPELTTRVDKAISQILPIYKSPLKREVLFIKDTALTAIADRSALQTINQGLGNKASQQRCKKTNKNHGEAQVLSDLEIRERIQEREAKEAIEEVIKTRNRALRSSITCKLKIDDYIDRNKDYSAPYRGYSERDKNCKRLKDFNREIATRYSGKIVHTCQILSIMKRTVEQTKRLMIFPLFHGQGDLTERDDHDSRRATYRWLVCYYC